MHRHQKTIKHKVKISGKGLHSGQNIDIILNPKPIDTGVWFHRIDKSGTKPLLAVSANVSDTSLATTIGFGQESVGTLEHLLAALGGLGINNILVEVNGPEAPIFDGSARPWVDLLKNVGLQTLNAPRSYYKLRRPFEMRDGDKMICAEPAAHLSVDFSIDFPGIIKTQRRLFNFTEAKFVSEISSARTFCLLSDVEKMQKAGKALGGGLDNAVVVSDDGVLNPEGLRYSDECVRHKILDFLGDMALVQAPIVGRFKVSKSGHGFNHSFFSALMAAPGVLDKVTLRHGFCEGYGPSTGPFAIPSFLNQVLAVD
jgi:UDP-3-O-[3-hydroxymyristoyl] N-acetylglucosamine deacetylase